MLRIGDVINVVPEGSKGRKKFRCKLVGQKDGILYIVDAPVKGDEGKAAFLQNGMKVICNFVADDGNQYIFHSVILRKAGKNNCLIKLTYPGDDSLHKIQRRSYVRVKTAIDVAVHSLNDEFAAFVAVSDDFSAGGVSIFCKKEIPLYRGMEVNLWISLPMQSREINYLSFRSKIVRITPKNEYQNRVAFEFLEVAPAERQLMIRYSFEQQLLLRKKGYY